MVNHEKTWFKIEIKYDLMDMYKNVRLRQDFAEIWRRLGCPTGLNLFELKEQPRDREIIYAPQPVEALFATLLQNYGALPCDKPDGATVKAVIQSGQDLDHKHWFG